MAADRQVPWRADSRALAVELGSKNIGPISQHARRGLAARGIMIEPQPRNPQQATDSDFRNADIVIAVKEREHRPLVESRFPAWASKVRYWDIDDVGDTPVEESLAAMEREISLLLHGLCCGGNRESPDFRKL